MGRKSKYSKELRIELSERCLNGESKSVLSETYGVTVERLSKTVIKSIKTRHITTIGMIQVIPFCFFTENRDIFPFCQKHI